MGIPKFFQYVSERYPCILELINESQIPDFDNFYLDMNGIFHNSAPQYDNFNVYLSEEDIFNNIFHYIDKLINIIRPKKLIFLAVDGVAPRAKMNQQRARRFKSSKDRELIDKKALSKGQKLPDIPRIFVNESFLSGPYKSKVITWLRSMHLDNTAIYPVIFRMEKKNMKFDSNCITPGTEFMIKLQSQLEYFVAHRISNHPHWQSCKVILSGQNVPGEGEHKVMEYIRYLKTLDDYDPHATHCFYGLDADLIILGLCSHEQNFCILREEVIFGRKKPPSTKEPRFFLLHLTLLREYLDLEFRELISKLSFKYDPDSILDDWVLLGFILGNDFIPHLPDFHIATGAIPVLYEAYKQVLPTLDGYMNEKGYLNLPRFQKFMDTLAKYELESFQEKYSDLSYFEQKTGRKFHSEEEREKGSLPKDSELERLIASTNESLGLFDDEQIDDFVDTDCEQESDDNEDTFLKEYSQHKRHYYNDKLKQLDVTSEVLKSQAEGYIRGLQWILHYYYHGCRSWSWFYPHHYAPFTSDIVNFSDVSLDFEEGLPFLPYQQLLAILPPASKNLVPQAYQNLMISDSSPIKNFYPEDFETDLNGKINEWESVVLLPMIDEKILLSAMEECDANLTAEEKNYNKHGPMLVYSYTSENLGTYKAPMYQSDITSNHAVIKTLWRHEVAVNPQSNKKREVDRNLYIPGFPTFKYKQFEVSRKKGKVKLLNRVSSNDSIILSIKGTETVSIESLASDIIGKNIYVNWPFLLEARVLGVVDEENGFYLNGKDIQRKELTEEGVLNFSNNISSLTCQYMKSRGIEIGLTKILVIVNVLQGLQKTLDSSNSFSLSKVWSKKTEFYPLQTIVLKDEVKILEKHIYEAQTTQEMFPEGSHVFKLGYPYYGCMGTVANALDKLKNDRIQVILKVPLEQKLDRELLTQSGTTYYTASLAGQKSGISPLLIAQISGNIFVDMSEPGKVFDKKPTLNIGLQLKFNKANEEVPGYTKKEKRWLYSNKAINVMTEYVTRYHRVVEYLANSCKDANYYKRRDIFPGPNGLEEVQEMVDWLKTLECSQIERVSCGSQVLEKDIVHEIEKIIDSSPKEYAVKTMLVKPQLLFKSDLISSGLSPVEACDNQLLDRVISVKPCHDVPLGLRGYIIGIYKGKSESDSMYDILYDEPFPAGLALNCSPGRGYRTTKASFINISHGERLSNQLSKQTKLNHVENTLGVLNKERPSSAFAPWNQHPEPSLLTEKADQFKSLWSYLERVKSQNETKVLKKILKIEEDDKPKIEDNVKSFFEHISKAVERTMPKDNSAEIENVKLILQNAEQQTSDKRYCVQLNNFFQERNFPPPNFMIIESGDKVMCQIVFPDRRMFSGCPCPDEESARDSAALEALTAIGIVQLNNDCFQRKESEMVRRKIIDNQAKSEKGSLKNYELDPKKTDEQQSKATVKAKQPNDKVNRSKTQPSQNQKRNNVPHMLPTPPLQWCRQFKTSAQKNQNRFNDTKSEKNDHSGPTRIQTENRGHDVRQRTDLNIRNPNWRQDDKARSRQIDGRSDNDFARNKNLWHRLAKIDSSSALELRPDVYHVKQGSGALERCSTEISQFQVGGKGSFQRLSAVATEFIPLQALTRNRNRGNVQSTISKQMKEEEKEVIKPASPVKLVAEFHQDKGSLSLKQRRKSKIAAKFDLDWDPQG